MKNSGPGNCLHWRLKLKLFGPSFEGSGKTINELEKAENIDQMLIRFLTVRVKKHDLEKNYFEKRDI